jgi:hypothetical protein
MLVSTFLNVIFIPVLYVVVRTLVPGEPGRRSAAAAVPSAGGPEHSA